MKKTSVAKPQEIKLPLGTTLKALRETADINQTELGKLLDLHQTAVCRVEQNSQSLTPEQLVTIGKFFDISVSDFLDGDVDYWRVAERFGETPSLPKKYRELPFSKVRELLPMLAFLRKTRGDEFTTEFLASLKIPGGVFFGNPDHKIGVNCNLDLLRTSISEGVLNTSRLKALTDQTRLESSQGFLHRLYQTQANPLYLVQTWILNSHHYETNFKYNIESLSKKKLEVSIEANPHMRDVNYHDEILGDFLCQYKKSYFAHLPNYIQNGTLDLDEKECHFHGAEKCVYELRAG